MAITASMAINDSTLTSGQVATATCTVSNSGSGTINVTSIAPTATPNGATPQSVSVANGVPAIGASFPVAVTASGTLAISWSFVAHAPTTSYGLSEPGSYVYSLGAVVCTSDGSCTVATPVTVTVTNPALT